MILTTYLNETNWTEEQRRAFENVYNIFHDIRERQMRKKRTKILENAYACERKLLVILEFARKSSLSFNETCKVMDMCETKIQPQLESDFRIWTKYIKNEDVDEQNRLREKFLEDIVKLV